LGFSEIEFDEIMKMKPVPHDYYPTDQTYIRPLIYLNNRFLKGKK